MACYNAECKKRQLKVAMGMSGVIIILGLVQLIIGLVGLGSIPEQERYDFGGGESLSGFGSTFATLGVVCGAVAILVGVCGLIGGWKNKKYCTGPYCFFAFLIGTALTLLSVLIMLAVALILLFGKGAICNTSMPRDNDHPGRFFKETVDDVMCVRGVCECKGTAAVQALYSADAIT